MMQDVLPIGATDPTSIPVCPICEHVLARRPVAFVNGKPWCRSCFVLMMKITRMQVFLALKPVRP